MHKPEEAEQLVYTGFVLGLKVAEQLNRLPDNCTEANPRVLEFLSAVGHDGSTGKVVPPLMPPLPTDSELADDESGFDDIMRIAATQVGGALYALRNANE